jgi:hypothetical protein
MITAIEITYARRSSAVPDRRAGAFDQLDAAATGELDPALAANRGINLDKASRNAWQRGIPQRPHPRPADPDRGNGASRAR